MRKYTVETWVIDRDELLDRLGVKIPKQLSCANLDIQWFSTGKQLRVIFNYDGLQIPYEGPVHEDEEEE